METKTWKTKLKELCEKRNLPFPDFNICEMGFDDRGKNIMKVSCVFGNKSYLSKYVLKKRYGEDAIAMCILHDIENLKTPNNFTSKSSPPYSSVTNAINDEERIVFSGFGSDPIQNDTKDNVISNNKSTIKDIPPKDKTPNNKSPCYFCKECCKDVSVYSVIPSKIEVKIGYRMKGYEHRSRILCIEEDTGDHALKAGKALWKAFSLKGDPTPSKYIDGSHHCSGYVNKYIGDNNTIDMMNSVKDTVIEELFNCEHMEHDPKTCACFYRLIGLIYFNSNMKKTEKILHNLCQSYHLFVYQ